jgi:hypothetical protein
MKLSRAPVFEFGLVSMGKYCQERATQVLNDFVAVGTFLLNDEETVSRWPGPCLSLTNVRRFGILGCVRRSSPAFSTASLPKRPQEQVLCNCKNKTTYRCSQRTTLGDMPVIRRKCLAKWLWSENPADNAISDIGRSVLRSICWACSMRRCST